MCVIHITVNVNVGKCIDGLWEGTNNSICLLGKNKTSVMVELCIMYMLLTLKICYTHTHNVYINTHTIYKGIYIHTHKHTQSLSPGPSPSHYC